MPTTSFYWYDYETTGLSATQDRVIQFAGLRTDLDLNPIAKPHMFYCKLSPDYLPSAEACLVTGISPQTAFAKGLPEPEFIATIQAEMSQAGTCTLGYNSLAFDDEFTRNLLYRNFYDPYAREYGDNRGRWDIFNMVRMTAALRPDGVVWPKNDQGVGTFKLTDLSTANQIAHEHAHDALGDVYATIAVAKLIKTAQPQLFDYLFDKIRDKHQVKDLLYKTQAARDYCVYTSPQLSRKQGYTSLILPLGAHPWDNNRVLALDLMRDPSDVLSRTTDDLQQALFDKKGKRPKGLCSIKVNACPALAPKGVLDETTAQRLGIDLAMCAQHQAQILADDKLYPKLLQVYDRRYAEDSELDPEQAIYQAFLKPTDKKLCESIRHSTGAQLATQTFNFKDTRLPTLLFRYRARHYPETLNAQEQQAWQGFCRQRLGLDNGKFDEYMNQLESLRTEHSSADKQKILNDLQAYAQSLRLQCAA